MSKKEFDYVSDLIIKYPELDFSRFKVTNSKEKSIVICMKHGEFEVSRFNLIQSKYGCKECANEMLNTIRKEVKIDYNKTKDYREKAKECRPEYDYSKFNPKNFKDKSIVICKLHGEFLANLKSIYRKDVKILCKECRGPYSDAEYKINELKNKFPNLDFSKFEFRGTKVKSIVICPKHGEMLKSYETLMRPDYKSGCIKCKNGDSEMYINRLKEKFPELDFSKFEYINNHTPGIVICKEHGEFTVRYNDMISNRRVSACPMCHNYKQSRYEDELIEYIKSIYDKLVIKGNRNIVLNEHSNRFLELDIYLPDIKLAIEFNGSYWHSDEFIKNKNPYFNSSKEYHDYKFNKCKEKDIELIFIDEIDYIENKNKVLEHISNNIKNKCK